MFVRKCLWNLIGNTKEDTKCMCDELGRPRIFQDKRPWLGPKSPLSMVVVFWVRWRGRRVGPWPESRIQDLDGGFFEKFGSLLKEQQDAANENEAVPSDSVVTSVEDAVADTIEDEAKPPVTLHDSDSEPEESDKDELISDAMGWNIQELYSEILYEIIHTVGSDATIEEEKNALFTYLQETFKLDNSTHEDLFERACAKEAPNILLNVEVVEGKDITPKDANGLSDPFCSLYLSSANSCRYNTSVKTGTLSPVWEEHFSLPVQNPAEDVFHIDVWDFDPAETVKEKMSKFGEVKGVKGLRKLMKEIAVTASTGKHDNELVGSAEMPLKNIPSSGMTYWCSLQKKNKAKKQGDLKVKLAFSSEKNHQVASQEHRHLLRLIVLHELEKSKVDPFHWCGKFSSQAEVVLTQHRVQCGLTSVDIAFTEWVEYISVHVDHPLSFSVFPPILQKLTKPLQNSLLQPDEVKMFWDATRKLLPSCMTAIRKIRKLTPSDKYTLNQIASVLSTLSQLATLQPPNNFDMFPCSIYGWLESSEEPNCDIVKTVKAAVTQGGEDWFSNIMDNNKLKESTDESRLHQHIKLVQLVRTDLQKAVELHDRLFLQTLRFPYAATLFSIYESKVSDMTEEVVKSVCRSLRPLKFIDPLVEEAIENDPLAMGTTLFELYLALQRLSVLGSGLHEGNIENFKIHEFHTWFHRGVAQWLDIALYKALQRIEKAIELDELVPVDSNVKYSSSAIDSLAIFYQVKIFWQQLAWPDVEGSYAFVAKIIDDICRCSVFYADKMSKKVEGLGETQTVYEKKFEVTTEWCLAINNIEYVRQSIEPFVRELGMEEILSSLAEYKSQSTAEHCGQTLQLVIDNAVETVGNKILELMETVAEKMTPSITKFLLEGAELLNQDSNSVDRLMKYLDDNLITLHSQLDVDNFDRILQIIWENLSHILSEIVDTNLEKRRPPSFFASLGETLKVLVSFFRQGDEKVACDSEVLKRIEHLLMVHGLETSELIHQFNLERLVEQDMVETRSLGLLTVRLQFVEDKLRVEILNARNIRPMDSNGTCDPYVKVHLLPEEKFPDAPVMRTKTHKKTLFPLYDEQFTVYLNSEQQQIENGIVQFVLKDQDFLGMRNEFIGEAFISFKDIPKTEISTGLEQLEQIHLKLHRPAFLGTEAFRALDNRQGDKLARDFIKKQKSKMIYKDAIK